MQITEYYSPEFKATLKRIVEEYESRMPGRGEGQSDAGVDYLSYSALVEPEERQAAKAAHYFRGHFE